MKNLFLLPTEKPSRFYSTAPTATKKEGYAFGEHYIPNTRNMFSNHNIYITSEEDLKDNDYIITKKDGRLFQVSYLLSKVLIGSSKVILTTDQDLIKDGVQAIDDEFLEWFVKNPSCEWVEVFKLPKQQLSSNYYSTINWIDNNIYKIIISKEEHKQETLEELKKWKQEALIAHEINQKVIEKLMAEKKLMYSEEEVLPLLEMLEKCKDYFLLKTDAKSEERADAIGQAIEDFKKLKKNKPRLQG
jgi:hypothetical protein